MANPNVSNVVRKVDELIRVFQRNPLVTVSRLLFYMKLSDNIRNCMSAFYHRSF